MKFQPLILLAVIGVPAVAQTPPPNAPSARNGNVYNGTAHEPNAPATSQQEQSAGVAAPPAQQRQEQDDLNKMSAQLQDKAAKDAKMGHEAACGLAEMNCQGRAP